MKAVFMDASGVLYCRQRDYRFLRAFLQSAQLPAPSADELQRLRNSVKRQDGTDASREDRYAAFLAALGVTQPRLQAEGVQVLVREAAEITLFPGVAATLRTLKARGFKLGVITNTVTPGREKQRWLARCGIDVEFDGFVASCDVGVAKPHPRIYLAALAECGVTPGEAVFVGHAADELDGAHAVGLRTVACAGEPGAWADDRIAQFAGLLTLPYLQAPDAMGVAVRYGE